MAGSEKHTPPTGGTMGFLAMLLVFAMLGGAAGFSLKFVMPGGEKTGSDATKSDASHEAVKPSGTDADKPGAKSGTDPSKELLMALEPIVVTLAESKGARLRIEASVIFVEVSKVDRGLLLREMAQDLMTFLRTTTLAQIETASGLEFLREDLAELVQLRSKGSARGIVIKALMVE
jgi:flagellar protein FliL